MILLISIKTLKDNYLIDDNLEDRYLLSNIVKGQDFVIRPLIGDSKYNSLIQGVEDGTLTEDDKYLLAKIEPVLAYYTMSEVMYSSAYKFKNQGLEEGANSSRFSELVSISKKYALDSQHYAQILGDYFSKSCNKTNKVYKTGLYLG